MNSDDSNDHRKPYKKTRRETSSSSSSSSYWSDLPCDLLRQVFERLNFVDRARASSVCRFWQRSIESSSAVVNPTPWLWIPPQRDEFDGIKRENRSYSRLYNPADHHLHRTKAFSKENTSSFCVGASHGHLIFLDCYPTSRLLYSRFTHFIPFIFNPLTGARFPLPKIGRDSFSSFPFSLVISTLQKLGVVTIGAIRDFVVHKAILTSDPTDGESQAPFTVALLYGDEQRRGISVCQPFSDYSWSELEDADCASYHDVSASADGFLYALGEDYSVEVWNLRWDQDFDRPVKVMSFSPSVPKQFPVGEVDCSVSRCYIMSGGDDIMPLLVARIVGEFVDREGNVLCSVEMMQEEEGSNHPAVCPYRTVGFEVYKMDVGRRSWVRTKSLSEGGEKKALFLGGSHSISVLAVGEIAADCIYFTDDYWAQMDEDYLYGGHDLGVFDVRYEKIRRLNCEFEEDRFDPPPSWLVPSHCNCYFSEEM